MLILKQMLPWIMYVDVTTKNLHLSLFSTVKQKSDHDVCLMAISKNKFTKRKSVLSVGVVTKPLNSSHILATI